MNKKQNNGFDYYRIKMEWVKEQPDGSLQTVKTEELVYATSYTEAEELVNLIVENQSRTQFGNVNYEIVKTKINDVVYNDILSHDKELVGGFTCNYFQDAEETGTGLYNVKGVIFYLDETSGKNKQESFSYFIPATSNINATKYIDAIMKHSSCVYAVRDTKFDKSVAIYWPVNVYQQKTQNTQAI